MLGEDISAWQVGPGQLGMLSKDIDARHRPKYLHSAGQAHLHCREYLLHSTGRNPLDVIVITMDVSAVSKRE